MRILMFSILATLFAVSPTLGNEKVDRQVEELARNLRINIYQTYRTNRPEYDRRMEQANEALRRYKFAKTEEGGEQVHQWFATAESNFGQWSDIPEIALTDINERFQRKRHQRKQKVAKNQPRTKEGFVKTAFQQKKPSGLESLTKTPGSQPSESSDGGTTVSGLFKNIGKSFLRKGPSSKGTNSNGPSTPDTDTSQDAGSSSEDTHTDGDSSDFTSSPNANGPTDFVGEAADGTANFDALERDFVNYNLTVEMLNEDFLAIEERDIATLNDFIQRIRSTHSEFQQLQSKKLLLTDEEQSQLTAATSLENVATEFMTAVNELSASDEFEDQADQIETLREEISQVLAVHTS